jgi:hypothetical protein
MIDDGVVPPSFYCPTLPRQNRIDFDAAAPSSQMPANLQFSPFDVSCIDPSLVLMDIDQEQDTPTQIDSLPLDAPSALENTAYIDHNPLSTAQEEVIAIPRAMPAIPTPYSFVLGCPTRPEPPFSNILGLIPEDVKPFESGNDGTCSEIRDNLSCNNPVALDSTCQCILHEHDDPPHVCNVCCKLSAQESKSKAVNDVQMLAMRAYLCADCSAQVSQSVAEVLRRRIVGAANIWGDCSSSYYTKTELEFDTPHGMINFRGEARPMTGCACASKLFSQRLCRSHRRALGRLVVIHVLQMREWCLKNFGRNVCPGCLVDKPPNEANLSRNSLQVLSDRGPHAWVCLVCGDWVVNQKHPPGILPGGEQWFPPSIDGQKA